MQSSPTASENLSPLKRAILEIRDLRAQLDQVEAQRTEPVAIIGLGLRFPGGATDAQSFWQLLKNGKDAVTEVPADRWDVDAFYDANPGAPGKMTTRHGAFVPGADGFDAQFFGISPREAISMDPQQRLLLEVTWEALENAGQAPDRLAGSDTGVFVGISSSDYLRIVFSDPTELDTYVTTGNASSVAAGRLAYLLGLHGPTFAIDTACSSSLVAVHLACQSLRQRDCRLALASGVNLILLPDVSINFSKSQMLATDGHCKTFDARADGYVRGEGCATVVLKRLSEALAEGDHILAVIRGSAINHDGRSSGLTAPNGPAQEAVIRAALADAGVEPADVSYVEAHGTGTALGDPIEVQALGAVLGPSHTSEHPLLIGSVKTNIGHLEAAAGLAGLIKVVLSLQHDEIPPHLHFQSPNPHILWNELPIAVNTQAIPWPAGRRVAGVSSFGLSGTNAHVIVEQAPKGETTAAGVERPQSLVTLSARSAPALQIQAQQLEQYLAAHPTACLPDVAYTLNAGRTHYAHRLGLTADSMGRVRKQLAAVAAGQLPSGVARGQASAGDPLRVVFLFTGHGSHYVNMGRQLYETQPLFHQIMDRCDEVLRPYLGQSLLAVLYPQADPSQQAAALQDMSYGQPAMFALQYALASLWRVWGIEPTAVAGHSVGEYAAACIGGVLSLEDALKLVAERGRLMQALPEDGEMVTVFANEATVAAALAPLAADVSIAAINSPETLVISGRSRAVQQVVENLRARKIKTRRLPINRAAHSPMVEPMLPALAATSAEMHLALPQIEFVSTVTGQSVRKALTHPEYWQRHLRQGVRFAAAMQTLEAEGYRAFLEIGPNPTLLSLGQRCVADPNTALWLPSLREGWADWQPMLESLASLYTNGATVDWAAFDQGHARHKLPLPTYPWERKSYWWTQSRPQPAVLPASGAAWPAALAGGRRQAQQGPLDLALSTFAGKWESLNRLATAYMATCLQALGAYTTPGEQHTSQTLIAACKIKPTYQNLMGRWLKQLAVSGLLVSQPDGSYASPQPFASAPFDALWRDVREKLADFPALAEYLERCGQGLTAVLTGRESPLETLFPGGSFATTENLYQHWAHARYFNSIVSAAVEAIAQALPGRPLRILEIGAGIGATTASVLPVLPGNHTTYFFTDISDLFLNHARQKFAAYPFVSYRLLDVEKDSQTQGFPRHGFDVIIAANVLHATHNLNATLQNVLAWLAPEGVLVLFEATTPQPWYDISTGLIEGWQSFSDELRLDSPLLPPAKWKQVLEAAGFRPVEAFPEAGSAAEILGEHVILAQAPAGLQPTGEFPPEVRIDAEGAASPARPEASPPVADILQRLHAALPDERKELLIACVASHIAAVLRLETPSLLERRSRLMDLGVDSLMAVEIRGRLTNSLGLPRNLPATLIFDYPTVEAIADYLLRDVLTFDPAPAEATAPAPVETAPALANLADMSEAEVEALLMKKLRQI